MTPLAATEAERLVREAFEQYASDDGEYPAAIERAGDGYMLMQTHQAWITWQDAWAAARASQQSAAQATAEPVAWCVKNPNGDVPPVLIFGNGMAIKPGDKLFLAAPDRAPSTIPPVTLTPEQCDEFRRHPGTFNEMVQAIYSAGYQGVFGMLQESQGECWKRGARISELESARAPSTDSAAGWISVDERLPDSGTPILALTAWGDMVIEEWVDYSISACDMNPTFPGTGYGWCENQTEDITHWMPLPDPPIAASMPQTK